MAEEQTNDVEENIITPLEAYNILLQRQMSEDRIVVERTNIFFLAQSFLFMAFIALLNPDLPAVCNIIRIALPVIGILLTLLLYHLNQAAINASSFWHVGQRKIEEEDTFFNYMWENEITPHTHGWECTWGQKEWKRDDSNKWKLLPIKSKRRWIKKPLLGTSTSNVYVFFFPLTILTLWIVSLVVAIAY